MRTRTARAQQAWRCVLMGRRVSWGCSAVKEARTPEAKGVEPPELGGAHRGWEAAGMQGGTERNVGLRGQGFKQEGGGAGKTSGSDRLGRWRTEAWGKILGIKIVLGANHLEIGSGAVGLSRALEEPRWEPSEGHWLHSGSSRKSRGRPRTRSLPVEVQGGGGARGWGR